MIFAPSAANPGFECCDRTAVHPELGVLACRGIDAASPLGSLPRGRHRLTVYAWDWADNRSALDYWFKVPLAHAADAASPEFGPLEERFEFGETG